jgi:hypothetical protein
VFFVDLHVAQKQIDCPRVVVVVCHARGVAQLLDHDEQIRVCFGDHLANIAFIA